MVKLLQVMNMNRQYFWGIIGAALICVILIFIFMWREAEVQTPQRQEQLVSRPVAPFKSYISAVGIVEASSGNILIGMPVGRVIDKVLVTVGSKVKKGDVLFKLEARDLGADLFAKQVAYKTALVRLQKLEALPRPEDVAAAEASTKRAEVGMEQAKSQYEMVQGLQDSRAISQEAINNRKFTYEEAKAKWDQANASLDKIKAGTWKPDLDVARLEALQAKADYERVQTEIQRNIIHSPIDGTILQVKIHEGELPPADVASSPVMIIGNVDKFHLRVGVNQFDAPYFQPNSPAVAFLQGDASQKFPLEFVRVEPYMVHKQDLTHDIAETVDTRVLQVIYNIKDFNQHVYVGQQMDVFIETHYSK